MGLGMDALLPTHQSINGGLLQSKVELAPRGAPVPLPIAQMGAWDAHPEFPLLQSLTLPRWGPTPACSSQCLHSTEQCCIHHNSWILSAGPLQLRSPEV